MPALKQDLSSAFMTEGYTKPAEVSLLPTNQSAAKLLSVQPFVHVSLQDTSLWSRTPSAVRKTPIPNQAYYCLLGHLYAAARLELMRMGQTLKLSQYTPAGPAHGNVSCLELAGIYALVWCCGVL